MTERDETTREELGQESEFFDLPFIPAVADTRNREFCYHCRNCSEVKRRTCGVRKSFQVRYGFKDYGEMARA